MELKAVIEGLSALKKPCHVHVYTDSQWLVNCATRVWRRKVHADLWAELDALMKQHKVIFLWIRGHNGHPENERVDIEAQRIRRTI